MKWIALVSLNLAMGAWATEQTLINGTPADPRDFPASVWTRSCSATVVGPRAVFIAAHCVSGNSTIRFSAGANRYSASCSISPAYNGNSTADYALCETNQEVTGVPYEVINTDPNRLNVGDQVQLTGYGCVNPGGGGGNDGTYRIGYSTIRSLPSGSNNDIVTRGGAALCYGDSGGPAFHYQGESRVLISTNSRGNISTTSYLSSTHTSTARRFFDDWTRTNNRKVCGIQSDTPGCRGQNPPDEGVEFEIDYPIVSVKGKLKEDYSHLLLKVRTSVEMALDELVP